MKITRRLAGQRCTPDNVGCPAVLDPDTGDFLIIGTLAGPVVENQLASHGAAVGPGEAAVVVPGNVLHAAVREMTSDE